MTSRALWRIPGKSPACRGPAAGVSGRWDRPGGCGNGDDGCSSAGSGDRGHGARTFGDGPGPACGTYRKAQCELQHFRTRACPAPVEVAGQVTGLPGRHLDSWLMPDPTSAARSSSAGHARRRARRGRGDAGSNPGDPVLYVRATCLVSSKQIAEILDLPIVAVVPMPERLGGDFHLPRLPDGIDGVFIDRIADPDDLPRLRRLYRPGVQGARAGGLGDLARHSSTSWSRRPGARFLPEKAVRRWQTISSATATSMRSATSPAAGPFPGSVARILVPAACPTAAGASASPTRRTKPSAVISPTPRGLEALGAELVEFSPLRDEALPEGVDLVMIGCGMPDQYADGWPSNLSMMAALREHVCRGQRIYSEGGGTAYLGHWMIIDGRPIRRGRHLAVRRRASSQPQASHPGDAAAPARLVARPQGDDRPRIQERPLAAAFERRAARVPHLLRLTDHR